MVFEKVVKPWRFLIVWFRTKLTEHYKKYKLPCTNFMLLFTTEYEGSTVVRCIYKIIFNKRSLNW